MPTQKSLYERLMEAGLETTDFDAEGPIMLRDDSDGKGQYIWKWLSDKAIPEGFTVGKA